MKLAEVLQQQHVKDLVNNVCGSDTDLIERENMYMLRNSTEEGRDVRRVIILPPLGYTANAPDQTNSHDEALFANIDIKGTIREGKKAFSKVKDCLRVVSFPKSDKISDLNEPYLTVDPEGNNPGLVEQVHSAGGSPFPVVKPDGFGFYHNLVNQTEEWLVMTLHKRLRPQRSVDLVPHLEGIDPDKAQILAGVYEGIVRVGDGIFKEIPEAINAVVTEISPEESLPALGEMLFAHDTGRHEACSAFAMILKVGKDNHDSTLMYLQEAMESGAIPEYYATQLLSKLEKRKNLAGLSKSTGDGDIYMGV